MKFETIIMTITVAICVFKIITCLCVVIKVLLTLWGSITIISMFGVWNKTQNNTLYAVFFTSLWNGIFALLNTDFTCKISFFLSAWRLFEGLGLSFLTSFIISIYWTILPYYMYIGRFSFLHDIIFTYFSTPVYLHAGFSHQVWASILYS